MKIARIEVFVVGNPWKNWVLVKVITDEGASGWGDATCGLSSQPVAAAVREISRLCIGRDPRCIEALWDHAFKALYLTANGILLSAISGITTACWDILARSLGVPLHALFGGRVHDRLRAYANGWYQGPRDPVAFGERAAEVAAMGYTALKFDPFGANYRFLDAAERRLSLDLVAAVRRAVGDRVSLLIEAHDRFTVPEAIRLARDLEEFDPEWIEAPVWSEDIAALQEVAGASRVRIVAGERFSTPRQFADLLAGGRFDVLQPEYVELGGIARLREVAAIADAHGASLAPHNARCPLSTAVNVHVMTATRNFRIQETFDDFHVAWARDLFAGVPQVRDGFLAASDAPGLGVEVNEALFAKHPYSEHHFMNLFAEGWEKRNSPAAGGEK
jgi:galactonate dehydratase